MGLSPVVSRLAQVVLLFLVHYFSSSNGAHSLLLGDAVKDDSSGRECVEYFITFLIYMPSASAAYFVYGDKVQDNILNTLPRGTASTIISVLMSAHLLFGIIIVLNPVSQELEHVLNIPEKFTWKRLISRTLMMCFVLFIVESVPHFSSILSLVGGSTITILAFICPPLFYIKLYESRSSCNTSVPLHKKVFMYEIVFIGLVAGIAATYSAIMDLAVNKFTVPCYVDPNKAWQNT